MSGRILSVNVSRPEVLGTGRLAVLSAIGKRPVSGRVAARRTNLDGDQQADLTVHGGPDKAVYAYATEDAEWWMERLGRDLPAGSFGENLSTEGIDLGSAHIGERWRVGSVTLEVAQPRIPCYKLGLRFGDRAVPRRFAAAGRPGAYLRVITEGELGAGDAVVVTHSLSHQVTVAFVAAAYHHDHALAAQFGQADRLPDGWRRWTASLHPGQD